MPLWHKNKPMDKELTKQPESFAVVRFQDCDPFNHLNNANYINYFINAREDQLLKEYDIDMYRIIQKTGLGWVVSMNQIAYLYPAFLMEKVLVQSQIIAYGEYDITVEMKMYDEQKKRIKAVLWVNFVHFNIAQNKAEKHAEEWIQLFKNLHCPIEEQQFTDRVNSLRKLK